jgi:hypothetical protein
MDSSIEETSMERISGPFNGFYIATRAAAADDRLPSFLAYAKICRGRPDNYENAHFCAQIAVEDPHATAQSALQEAELRARAQTGRLAPFAFAPAQ